jgi:NAD(P)-dependent dehydrogenase (short-subunit alcohol dehydrogenase family)
MSKTILITGANRGLGFVMSKKLAELGHQVILTGRDEQKINSAAEKITNNCFPLKLDVTRPSQIANAFDIIQKEFTNIDILINNAGSVFDHAPFEQENHGPLYSNLDVLKQSMELNLYGPYQMIQTFLPLLTIEDQRTDIINISSGMGAINNMGTGVPTYRISKAALNALTSFLKSELSATNIHVNSVCPGWCATELGGENAPRSPLEGIQGVLWIIQEQPDINGQFIRDREIIPF